MGYEIYDKTVLNSEVDYYGNIYCSVGWVESDSEVDQIVLSNKNLVVFDIENGCFVNW